MDVGSGTYTLQCHLEYDVPPKVRTCLRARGVFLVIAPPSGNAHERH